MAPYLTHLREIVGKATPGPWRSYPVHGPNYAQLYGPESANDYTTLSSQADGTFIATFNPVLASLLLDVCEAAENQIEVDEPPDFGEKLAAWNRTVEALAALKEHVEGKP